MNSQSKPFYLLSNWKMYGKCADVANFIKDVGSFISQSTKDSLDSYHPKVIICPPHTALETADREISNLKLSKDLLTLGAQNASRHFEGSYTGEVSVSMLAELNVQYTLLGHSERRQSFKENCDIVRQKAICAQKAGIIPVVCIGETIEDKEDGMTEDILRDQIHKSLPKDFRGLVSYEPIWAIGNGITPTQTELENITSFLKLLFEEELSSDIKPELLYGGSVSSRTLPDIIDIPGLAGVLMGKAGRNEEEFKKIWDIANQHPRPLN